MTAENRASRSHGEVPMGTRRRFGLWIVVLSVVLAVAAGLMRATLAIVSRARHCRRAAARPARRGRLRPWPAPAGDPRRTAHGRGRREALRVLAGAHRGPRERPREDHASARRTSRTASRSTTTASPSAPRPASPVDVRVPRRQGGHVPLLLQPDDRRRLPQDAGRAGRPAPVGTPPVRRRRAPDPAPAARHVEAGSSIGGWV